MPTFLCVLRRSESFSGFSTFAPRVVSRVLEPQVELDMLMLWSGTRSFLDFIIYNHMTVMDEIDQRDFCFASHPTSTFSVHHTSDHHLFLTHCSWPKYPLPRIWKLQISFFSRDYLHVQHRKVSSSFLTTIATSRNCLHTRSLRHTTIQIALPTQTESPTPVPPRS